jgi:hypothetical protein
VPRSVHGINTFTGRAILLSFLLQVSRRSCQLVHIDLCLLRRQVTDYQVIAYGQGCMRAPQSGASEVIFIELLAAKFSIRGIFSLIM